MSQYAIYAPSSAHRWSKCTASVTAIAQLPPQDEGDEARDGTAAHEEIERCLSGSGAKVNPDHPAAYGVGLLLDYVSKLPPGKLWIEQRVELTKDIWGRCDVAHYDAAGETLTIVDYKNGYVDVQAEENEQLQIYAAASIYTHNLAVKWIRLVVVQPNSFMPVPRVKQWVVSSETLFEFAKRIAVIPAGPLTFVAGEHCRYCPLFGRCDATKDPLAKLSLLLLHGPDEVRPDQVATFKACQKPIEDWFKGLDKHATKLALSGKPLPGMKLVQTSKHRVWKDVTAALKAVIEKCGVEALDPPTPAQAEKLGMDEAWVSANSVKPDGGPALAFESDKRPTWSQKTGAEMFANLRVDKQPGS